MQKIAEWSYGPYITNVKITDEVREFFESLEKEINVTKDMNPDEWYQGWLLKHLDKNKDAIPDEEFGKEFELIFCGIIQNPEDFIEAEFIIEDLGINPEHLIFEGSTEMPTDDEDTKTKLWSRWIVIKKIL